MTGGRVATFFNRLFAVLWLLLLLGIAAVRWQWFGVAAGLSVVSLTSALLLLYGLFALPGVFVRMISRKPVMSATLTRCVLGLLPLSFFFFSVGPEGLRAPAIHDITTDLENPPRFVLASAQRDADDNPVAYEGEVIARLQAQHYPDLAPLVLTLSPAEAISQARAVAAELGWQILGTRPAPGGGVTLEAVATSALFNFEDDIAVRAVPLPSGGSKLDVRSASRVGLGDMGANAGRIRDYLSRLQQKN